MNNIRQIRGRLGVTQAVLASALKVSQGNVSNYEQGQTVPPEVAALLIAYASSLGHSITYDDVYSLPQPESQPQ
jgi:putative transcriptional regulator